MIDEHLKISSNHEEAVWFPEVRIIFNLQTIIISEKYLTTHLKYFNTRISDVLMFNDTCRCVCCWLKIISKAYWKKSL